ncbi:hypothetical protein S40288_06655 [Stachybotrys chartarum IBT 40288]|nr:hypothetical protein S40288_06655 [Stachybotrys chartarum IBT 40288]
MAVEAAGPAAKLTFLDLPAETQRDIFSHCSQSDLICLALVSRHFHELASALLYRNFHIIFPDDDDSDVDSPIDGLAGGLDTFTTSPYNYAQHLRDLSMDTLSAGVKGEVSYSSYLYSASCGKFLNTLLLLTLKRAKSLEGFRWNIRVELSRPVYQVLHRITSLKRLHLRMQAGESYYSTPPPLPVSVDAQTTQPSHHWSDIPPPPSDPNQPVFILPPGFSSIPPPLPPTTGGFLHNSPPPPKASPKSKASKRGHASREPPTLAGFKDLKTLSVLDIDNLDIVTEIKTCLRNSSSTLTELSLSLSDARASQARKPPPDSDPDDSDVEEDFQVVPASPGTNYDSNGPAKAFRAQEERKVQEDILGRVFDVEPYLIKKPHMRQLSGDNKADSGKAAHDEDSATTDPRQQFLSSLKHVSAKLMSLANGSREFSMAQQDILDTIEKAARKYVASPDPPAPNAEEGSMVKGKEATTEFEDSNNGFNPSAAPKDLAMAPGSSEANPAVNGSSDDAASSKDKPLEDATSNSRTAKGKGIMSGDVQPEDIDIEQVDGVDDGDDEPDEPQSRDGERSSSVQSSPPTPNSDASRSNTPVKSVSSPDKFKTTSTLLGRAMHNLAAQKDNFETLLVKLNQFQEQACRLDKRIKEMRSGGTGLDAGQVRAAEAQLDSFTKSISAIQSQIKVIEAEVEDVERQIPEALQAETSENTRQSLETYLRSTRGFSLEALSLHLIPVKASVLSRAVDLRSLRQLTLLNVGNQAPIWALLAKENKVEPLPLRSIFTDNVSSVFLTFVSQLEEVHELFMLERSPKHKPESFAPRTTTTCDQIRRLVLKKHISTLKRLMIKDEYNSPNWDANEKTMIMICTRGVRLEELAVSMNIHAVHAFMQYFSGLASLRAINILRFRNSDTCIWVMRELLKFIVDNLSHHPELKLEWIAMEDDRVDRVVRPSETDGKAEQVKKSNARKGKVKAPVPAMGMHESFPWLPADGLESESESEDEFADGGMRLRFRTVGPLQFYDVWGVKIFEKEIRSGRL